MLILVRIEQNDISVGVVVVSGTFIGLQSKDILSGASLYFERVGRLVKARHGLVVERKRDVVYLKRLERKVV